MESYMERWSLSALGSGRPARAMGLVYEDGGRGSAQLVVESQGLGEVSSFLGLGSFFDTAALAATVGAALKQPASAVASNAVGEQCYALLQDFMEGHGSEDDGDVEEVSDVGPDTPGYCYLGPIHEQFRSAAATLCGENPSVSKLASLPKEWASYADYHFVPGVDGLHMQRRVPGERGLGASFVMDKARLRLAGGVKPLPVGAGEEQSHTGEKVTTIARALQDCKGVSSSCSAAVVRAHADDKPCLLSVMSELFGRDLVQGVSSVREAAERVCSSKAITTGYADRLVTVYNLTESTGHVMVGNFADTADCDVVMLGALLKRVAAGEWSPSCCQTYKKWSVIPAHKKWCSACGTIVRADGHDGRCVVSEPMPEGMLEAAMLGDKLHGTDVLLALAHAGVPHNLRTERYQMYTTGLSQAEWLMARFSGVVPDHVISTARKSTFFEAVYCDAFRRRYLTWLVNELSLDPGVVQWPPDLVGAQVPSVEWWLGRRSVLQAFFLGEGDTPKVAASTGSAVVKMDLASEVEFVGVQEYPVDPDDGERVKKDFGPDIVELATSPVSRYGLPVRQRPAPVLTAGPGSCASGPAKPFEPLAAACELLHFDLDPAVLHTDWHLSAADVERVRACLRAAKGSPNFLGKPFSQARLDSKLSGLRKVFAAAKLADAAKK